MTTTTTQKAAHTPGPWKYEQQPDLDPTGNGFTWAIKANAVTSYAQNPAYANSEANARLIAAAPELLAMLQHALAFIKHDHSFADCPAAECDTIWSAVEGGPEMECNLKSIRAAIAKATKSHTPSFTDDAAQLHQSTQLLEAARLALNEQAGEIMRSRLLVEKLADQVMIERAEHEQSMDAVLSAFGKIILEQQKP